MGTVILPTPWLGLCLRRNVYTSLCFCNGTSMLTNCSAAIYPLITPMTHIKVTIFHRNKHRQSWHHLSCLYSETRFVLWVLRVATPEAVPRSWCRGLPELEEWDSLGTCLLRDGKEGLQPLGYSPCGAEDTQHAVISGEMDAKRSSGQGSSCPRWFLGVLRTCSSANVVTLCLIYLWASQPRLLLCIFTSLERLDQREQRECHPWILSADIHVVLCILPITGATIGWDHPWLSQLFKITNEIISWQTSASSFGLTWHQFLCGVLMDFKSSEALPPYL